jgi:glycerol-3-phosphate dehydrogenase
MRLAPAFEHDSRDRNLDRLRRETFDVLILGGGINGAGIARDLALRGAKVALVEQRHFASGTSGKNSQLIHGGLRYLKQLQFHLVREALRERATILRLAPHLVTPQPFLMPMYGWPARLFYGTGLALYDLLAGSGNIGRHRVLSSAEVALLEPGLARQGLTHGAVFYDCHVHSARFVIENIWDAARLGAVVVNYAQAQLGGTAVAVTDTLSGESFSVRAAAIVDAIGAWEPRLRLVRGSHIVIPRVNASENAVAYFEESGRIIFVIPWGSTRQLSLVGTTDVDHAGGPDSVHISPEETEYLLDTVHRLFPAARDVEPIAAFSSLRPLLPAAGPAAKASREHRIWKADDGVVHVAGGKYTTYRIMSAEAADLITRIESKTASTPLGGNTKQHIDNLFASAERLAAEHGLTQGEATLVVRNYGVQALNMFELLPQATPAGLTRLECAQIAFAIDHEMARSLADLMFVSTYRGYERKWTRDTLTPFATEMGRLLGWDRDRAERECATLAVSISAV